MHHGTILHVAIYTSIILYVVYVQRHHIKLYICSGITLYAVYYSASILYVVYIGWPIIYIVGSLGKTWYRWGKMHR